MVSNPSLSSLISKWLGTEAWVRDVELLTGLREYAANPDLQLEWKMVLPSCDVAPEVKWITCCRYLLIVYIYHAAG